MDELYKIRTAYLKMKGGICRYTGRSMEPTLKNGYALKIEPAEISGLKKGDLIIYENGNMCACHRFLRTVGIKDKVYFMEKGDNNLFPWFREEDCFSGRVVEMRDSDGILIDTRRWKKIPFFSRLCSFFWPIFFVRYILKKRIRSKL